MILERYTGGIRNRFQAINEKESISQLTIPEKVRAWGPSVSTLEECAPPIRIERFRIVLQVWNEKNHTPVSISHSFLNCAYHATEALVCDWEHASTDRVTSYDRIKIIFSNYIRGYHNHSIHDPSLRTKLPIFHLGTARAENYPISTEIFDQIVKIRRVLQECYKLNFSAQNQFTFGSDMRSSEASKNPLFHLLPRISPFHFKKRDQSAPFGDSTSFRPSAC